MGLKSLNLFTVLVTYIIVSVDSYETPTPLVEILNPVGFRVSIPDSPGIQLFAFHGNINKEMIGNEAGQFSVDIIRERNGLWTYKNPTAVLNPGDTLYFWTHVRVNGIGYEKFSQEYQVPVDLARVSDDDIVPRIQTGPEDRDVHIFSSKVIFFAPSIPKEYERFLAVLYPYLKSFSPSGCTFSCDLHACLFKNADHRDPSSLRTLAPAGSSSFAKIARHEVLQY